MAKPQAARRERRRPKVAERKKEQRVRPSGNEWVLSALAAAFLVSGAAGLMHEVVWARLLSLTFGATALAISTVLAAYMGGLAFGSYWIGRRTDRIADGRRAYALLEVAIGASALAVPFLLMAVEPVYGWVWRQTHASFATFSVLRLLLAGSILFGPTVLMGATLPVLADYCAGLQGRRVAPQWLYTMNLLGAVLGVMLAGFVVMPALGIWGTILTAAALNVGVGLAVLRLPALRPEGRPVLAPVAAASQAAPPAPPLVHPLIWCAAFFSGLLSMATQVSWTRVLSLIVGSTTYAFSSVLIVYLTALGVGSAFASRRGARFAHVGPALAVAHGVFALTMLVVMNVVNLLPYWYLRLAALVQPQSLSAVVLMQLVILCGVLVVPVLSAGTVLPLAIIAAAPPTTRTGPAVGRIYAINTLGAIVGALGGGFFLVPRLGSEVTLLVVCVVSALLAAAFALWARRPAWLVPAAVGMLLLVGLGVAWRPAWDFNELHSGVFEPGRINWSPGISLTAEGEKVLYHREGATASVLVGERPTGVRNLVINSRVNASDSETDMATQVLCAQLPMLFGPRDIKDMFILGWGSGVTVGSALLWPDLKVTAVEIEPAVIEGSRFFDHANNKPLDHLDRLRLLEDDARHILLADHADYDVIISEPSHPWVSGVANLFTQEYYRIVANRLRPEGVFVQWLQSYQISFDSFRSVIAAVQSVFPEVLVFRPFESYDTLLIATHQPLTIDLEELERRFQAEPVRADLARVGIESPEDLLATLYLGPDVVRRLAHGVRINTDNNMHVELRGPREYVQSTIMAATIIGVLKRIATPVEELLMRPALLPDDKERLQAYVDALEAAGRPNTKYAERLADLP